MIKTTYIGTLHSAFNCVRGLCKSGYLKEVLHRRDEPVDYFHLLQACIVNKALPHGKLIHAHVSQTGFRGSTLLQNTLVNMYIKCGSVVDARRVFDQMTERDVCSWTVMIAAYSRHGSFEEAIALFHQMQTTGLQSDEFTLATVLAACANLASLQHGMEAHEKIITSGFQSDGVVVNALIDMYAKSRSIEQACKVFDRMHPRDVVSWTAMVAGYVHNGLLDEALKLFKEMPRRNVVSWNAMIAGFVQNGHGEGAFNIFRQMQLAGVSSDSKTFASILTACANLAAMEQGMEVHEKIIVGGLQFDVFVMTSLLNMYAQCGRIEKARELFDEMHQRDQASWNAMITAYAQNGLLDESLKFFNEMPQRNVVSWNAMISGFAHKGQGMEALELFREMDLAGVRPDSKTFITILPVCADLAALEQGMEIHKRIIRSGLLSDVVVATTLVDMYAKCGSIEKARQLFDKMHHQDMISWNTMIAALAMHGSGKEALKLFEQMRQSGMKPDHITFVSVLSACNHAGLVDEGYQYFNCMCRDYYIKPTMEHYICMADLLGRVGRLDEAQDFINKMPIKPDAVVWGCLLGACRLYNNIELAESVAERLFELDPKSAAPYVLLSNIYAAASRWGAIEKVRKLLKDRGIQKIPGCSWIEVNKQVHAFITGDMSHLQT